MWTVSDRFLRDIAAPHTLDTVVTVDPPGVDPFTVRLTAGSITCDRNQRIRRTANLAIQGGDSVFQTISIPGTIITVRHGLDWTGGVKELVPQIVGELSSAATQIGDGIIQVNVADLWQRLARSNFLTAYTPPSGGHRVAEIIGAVLDAVPGTDVLNLSTDSAPIAVEQAWTSRADMIQSFAVDGGTEAFFGPDGTFIIRDQPQITDTPVWLFKGGPGGTITGMSRNRPLDQLYNTVIVQPASIDGSQSWTQIVAQITDPNNPRHPSIVGVAPYVWTAPTVLTTAEANKVAAQLLTKVQGTTETLSIDAVANPALEGGDVIRALSPVPGSATLTHFIDGFTLDLTSGGMTVSTRSNTEVPA